MRRFIILLALCLCLNGLAVAEQDAPIAAPEAAQDGPEAPPEADPNVGAASDGGTEAAAGENPEPGTGPIEDAFPEAAAEPEAGEVPEAPANPEAGDEAQPDEAADSEAAVNPESDASTEAAVNPESDASAEAAANPTSEASETAANAEAAADPESDASVETGASLDDATGPETGAGAEAAENPENAAKPDADAGTEVATDPEAAADPGNQASDEAGGNPEAVAGNGTAENPGADAGGAPGAEAEANPDANPDVNPEANPDAATDANSEANPAPAISEDAEAWYERDGVKQGGALEALVAQLNGDETVYIRVSRVLCLPQAPLKKLSGVKWLPDAEVFSDRKYEVRASREDPQAVEGAPTVQMADLAACGDSETGALYIWVAEAAEPAPEPQPEPQPAPEPVITVAAEGFTPGAWSAVMPTFTLGGIPEGASYTYAAIIYDERIIPLSGNTWTPEQEGVFTARFAMLDGIGDIVSASEKVTLWLDRTKPESVKIAPSEQVSYAMTITATDAVSGVAALSLDGGATWTALANDQVFTYAGDHAETFGPGSIQVRDQAGNTWVFEGEIHLEKLQPAPGPGGGGGGSGSGKKPKTHASGDGEAAAAEYDALALEVPAEPMTRLTVGGESMDLTLTLESASHPDAPIGPSQPFTARLIRWGAPSGGGTPDTLLLEAQPGGALGDEYTWRWRFNGEVYRALANSDIKYMALKAGGEVAAFPTEGFTGGTKYTELKMLGVSTRRFDYSLDMKVNLNPGYVSALSDCDFSTACDLSIRTEVENMAYELSGSKNSIMYYYDVYLGPEDMLNQPFGAYAPS